MNRFLSKHQVVTEYRLPELLQADLFRAVQPVVHDGVGEPLYLEGQLDRWLTDRFGAGPADPPRVPPRQTSRS